MRWIYEVYFGSGDDEDSTSWFEWMEAIKQDFKTFINNFLYDSSPKLKEKLESISKLIGEEYDFGIQDACCEMQMKNNYLVFDYPLFDEQEDEYYFNFVIINKNYKEFYFIDTFNVYHDVEIFILEDGKVQNYSFRMSSTYLYFNDDSLKDFVESVKKYVLK